MACNRETPSDRAASSAPPVRQSSDALVPCCNTNCHLFGCAATMNLCSQCYSEHILKEGSVFLSKPCDASGDGAVVRSNSDDAGGVDNCRIGAEDDSAQRIEDVPELGGCAVAPQVDESSLRELLMSKSKSMNRSVGVSDLHAIFRSVEASSVADMSGTASDLPHQRIPSPLSLSSASPRAFSPARRQVETKLPLPPLPPQQAVNRCLACRKRVGLLGFKCRCGDTFCALHRYSDKHDCSFDYKAAGRASIAKENPVVKASKIVKI